MEDLSHRSSLKVQESVNELARMCRLKIWLSYRCIYIYIVCGLGARGQHIGMNVIKLFAKRQFYVAFEHTHVQHDEAMPQQQCHNCNGMIMTMRLR